ncbi:MAG: hypothetical protein ACRC5C_14005, partial [Bacilli bacterium]
MKKILVFSALLMFLSACGSPEQETEISAKLKYNDYVTENTPRLDVNVLASDAGAFETYNEVQKAFTFLEETSLPTDTPMTEEALEHYAKQLGVFFTDQLINAWLAGPLKVAHEGDTYTLQGTCQNISNIPNLSVIKSVSKQMTDSTITLTITGEVTLSPRLDTVP